MQPGVRDAELDGCQPGHIRRGAELTFLGRNDSRARRNLLGDFSQFDFDTELACAFAQFGSMVTRVNSGIPNFFRAQSVEKVANRQFGCLRTQAS